MGESEIVKVCWHQLRIRSFRKIARLTRFQILDVICCKVDEKTGLVELKGEPGLRKKLGPLSEANQACDFRSIFWYVWTDLLKDDYADAEELEKEIMRRWKETPDGRMEEANKGNVASTPPVDAATEGGAQP